MEVNAPVYMSQLAGTPKKKKKPKKNAFSFFLDEKFEELKAQNFTMNSKADAISYAKIHWEVSGNTKKLY